jgi:hypothetical protein
VIAVEYNADYGHQLRLSGSDFEPLNAVYDGMARTRRVWQASVVACEIFDLLALLLEVEADARADQVETNDEFDEATTDEQPGGPSRWQRPTHEVAVVPQMLSTALLVAYAIRLAAGRYPIRALPMKSQRQRWRIKQN